MQGIHTSNVSCKYSVFVSKKRDFSTQPFLCVISMQQLVPCESFCVENPVQRVKLLKTGRAEAEAYILKKEENITNNALSTKVPPKTETKPNAGGRAITDNDHINEMDDYIQNSQTQQLQSTPTRPKVSKKLAKQADRPKPSTSGLNVIHMTYISSEETDEDEELEERHVACYKNRPY